MSPHRSLQHWLLALPAILLLVGCNLGTQGGATTPKEQTELATVPPDGGSTTISATPDERARAVDSPAPNVSTELSLKRPLSLQEPRLQGQDVRAVQERLMALGYTQVGEIDGIYGPQTEKTVRAFQWNNGLEVDGVVGPHTWERLLSSDSAPSGPVAAIADVDTGYLLGGARNESWLDPGTTQGLLQDKQEFQLYSFARKLEMVTGAITAAHRDELCDIPTVRFTPEPAESSLIAVSGPWNALPRLPENIPSKSGPYQQIMVAYLQAQGIAEPEVRLTRVVRFDLEGDGADEVLIGAERRTDPPLATAGDYSVIVMQKQINGEAQMVPLVGEYYPDPGESMQGPAAYAIVGVLDLNGDGRMEVIVDYTYHEGAGTQVYSIDGQKAERVLHASCGV